MNSPLFERTRLSRLPEKQTPADNKKDATKCVACEKSILRYEIEYCQSVKVCKACLGIYAAVDLQLDEYGQQKAIANRRAAFLGNFGGGF